MCAQCRVRPCPRGPALPLGDVGVGDTWPGLALGVLSCEGCWGAGLPQPDCSAEPGPAVGRGRAAQNNLQFLRFAVGGLGSGAVSPRERSAAARSARLRLSWPR